MFFVLLLVLSVGACRPARTCAADDECFDIELRPGLCLYDGRSARYCAVSTLVCPSLWRWDDDADPLLRQACVSEDLVPRDGGSDGDAVRDGGADDGGG